MAEPVPILILKNINKSFSGVPVLHNISLDAYPGEVHCIVGENGAGKSTLIKIISGAYTRDSGEVAYQGQTLHEISPLWARENGINTIYQEVDLIPSLTAAENIFLGNEPCTRWGTINWPAIRAQARHILDSMGAKVMMDVPIGRLKIAQQQMVAIAKALSQKSRVIILDEPTAVFTRSEIETLFEIIQRLKEQDIAVLYISHHLDEIFEIGDRVTVLRDGNLIRSDRVGDIDKLSLVKAMVGREIDFLQRNGEASLGEEVFRVEGLAAPGAEAEVSFTLHRGEIVGIAGLVGAGRTEMARMLIGAVPVGRGSITVFGKECHIRSPKHALDLKIGMVPENRKQEGLVAMRSMAENSAYSLVESTARFGIVSWPKTRETVHTILRNINVRPATPQMQVRYLSGGNQQKVVLAKWLAARSDILILDEPTRGVDVGARAEIYKLIQQLKSEGKAILMISSDMTEILTQSDRILVMADGRIAGELPGREATEEQVISLALQLGENEA